MTSKMKIYTRYIKIY